MKTHLIIIATMLLSAVSTFADDPPAAAKKAFDTLMEATSKDDYKLFQSVGDDAFKKGITEEAFSSVTDQLQPVLKDGYDAKFLTELTQQGHTVYLWKLTPKIGPDQFVAKLVLSGDSVSGFWIE